METWFENYGYHILVNLSRSPELYDQLDGPVRESLGPVPDLVADFPSLGATGQADFPSLGAQAKPPANKVLYLVMKI